MSEPRYSKEEVAQRGKEIYEQQIRAQVEPHHIGKFVVIDIETGDYELDEDDVAAMKRAAQKHRPDSLYGIRVGDRAMGRIRVSAARPVTEDADEEETRADEIGRRLDALGPEYRLSRDKQERMEELLAKQDAGSLAAVERGELEQLAKECDEIMLRRAQALHRVR